MEGSLTMVSLLLEWQSLENVCNNFMTVKKECFNSPTT